MKQIYQRFFQNGLLLPIIIPLILLSQNPPEGFQFDQSTVQVDDWSNSEFLMNDLLDANGDILGCMEMTACNYDPDATVDDGSCEEFDCLGECGGDAEDLGCGCDLPAALDYCADIDGDGLGAGESTSYCLADLSTDGSFVLDCSDEQPDCATNNDLGCGCGEAGPGCDNTCGSTVEYDDCGACGGVSECSSEVVEGQCVGGDFNVGEFNVSGFDCNGFCFGTICFDDSDNCYGEADADVCYDCEGTPYGTADLDCAGECGGDAYVDICDICDDDSSNDCVQDCMGEWDGGAQIDECGVCFGENDDMNEFGLSCQFGCTNVNASNYYCDDDVNLCADDQPPEGFIDDGTCTYNIEGTIEYYSNDAPIENVLVTIYGSHPSNSIPINSAYTDTDGWFRIFDVPIRNTDDNVNTFLYEHYYLEYSNLDDSPRYIEYVDANLIANVIVAIDSFDEYPYSSIAADVDLNDHINAFDATLIRRFLSGSLSSFNALDIRWKFVSEIDTIYDITNLTGINELSIIGIKLGDPNGNWVGY